MITMVALHVLQVATAKSGSSDIKLRKPVCTIVDPHGGSDLPALWRDILHEWNARVLECTEPSGVNLCSGKCLEKKLKIANYIASLPDNCWLKRALAWTTGRRKRIGRPTHTWDYKSTAKENFRGADRNSNADRYLEETYGILRYFFHAEVVRVEVRLALLVSLRPTGAAFGQAVLTRLDCFVFSARSQTCSMLSGIVFVFTHLHTCTQVECRWILNATICFPYICTHDARRYGMYLFCRHMPDAVFIVGAFFDNISPLGCFVFRWCLQEGLLGFPLGFHGQLLHSTCRQWCFFHSMFLSICFPTVRFSRN